MYWNKGTRLEFPDSGFTTSITTLVQARYEFIDRQEDAGEQNSSGFSVNRARLTLAGTALHGEFAYKLQTDFLGTDNDSESDETASVRDAYVQWQPCNDGSGVRMGQFRTAVSRQFNTEQWAMQFADRSRVSEFFTLGRSNGAMAFGGVADGYLQASGGLFNGESDEEGLNRAPVDTEHAGVVSLRLNPLGRMNPYEEGDMEWGEDIALSFGATYAKTAFDVATGASKDDVDSQIVNADANFKIAGLSGHAEFFYRNVRFRDAGTTEPIGFYLQSGYFLIPRKLEFAGRYGYLDCDDGEVSGVCSGVDKINEVSATVNYYFWRHSLKAQFGYDVGNQDLVGGDDRNDRTTNRWIFQVSGYF